MTDLMNMLKFRNMDSQNRNGGAEFDAKPSNDQCKQINMHSTRMSLCICTSNLCNSVSKYPYFSFSFLICIAFVVYLFPSTLLS